jgi:hypothetical protein
MTKQMGRVSVALAVIAVALGSAAGGVRADITYMDLTFDDKTIDMPLGQGGTLIGEATWFHANVQATVRAAPFDTPSLELHNTHASETGPIEFDLPNGAVESGLVGILMDLWFYQTGPGWLPQIVLYASDWNELCRVYTQADGSLTIMDTDVAATVPAYPTGRPLRIVLLLDMDLDTYSAWVDGVQRVENRAMKTAGRLFDKVVFQTGWNCAPENHFAIDRILVVDQLPPVPVHATTWGGIKALMSGQ